MNGTWQKMFNFRFFQTRIFDLTSFSIQTVPDLEIIEKTTKHDVRNGKIHKTENSGGSKFLG